MAAWPQSRDELIEEQRALAQAAPPLWRPPPRPLAVAGCFVCFPRGEEGPGHAGDPAWAGAALVVDGETAATAVVSGTAGAPYEPGLLALREGPLLEAAVRALGQRPDVLLVDATGRDHRRRAGLALHLGAVLELPSIGVTHRLLLADGPWPEEERGATSPFTLDGETVGYWLRTRARARPLAVHAGWRTEPDTAVEVVLETVGRARTPEPLRQARHHARLARADG